MPLPSDDPLLRWQYSLTGDHLFDDGRQPRAAALIGHHWPIPELTWTDPPDPARQGLGCWWYPQDLATAPVANAVAVLSVAARLGALAILGRHVLAEASEVHLPHEVEVSMPQLPPLHTRTMPDASLALAKRALTNLVLAANTTRLSDLMNCKSAIDELVRLRPDCDAISLSLGVAEFPYIGSPGARSERRHHPVAIYDASAIAQPPGP
jgi:hypothetical protein